MPGALERGWTAPAASGYRIGTAERDRVRDLLQRHTAEGRLTLDEFGERIDEVLRARTAVDLDHALRELPPVPADARHPARAYPAGTAGTAATLARRVPPVALAAAVGLLVVGVLTVVGALWPLWILLLVTRFVLIGSRRRGWRGGGPPWAGPYPAQRVNRWGSVGDDPSWSSQTRWV